MTNTSCIAGEPLGRIACGNACIVKSGLRINRGCSRRSRGCRGRRYDHFNRTVYSTGNIEKKSSNEDLKKELDKGNRLTQQDSSTDNASDNDEESDQC